MERLYGTRSASKVNLFGAGANYVAKNYFAETLSPVAVLQQHTLFGYYSLGLSESSAIVWANSLKTGSAKGPARYTRTTGPLAGVKGLRWCDKCARIEYAQMGFSTWQVIHQLPFIHACPEHNLPLYVKCQDCQTPLDTGGQFLLPGEPCGSCGSLKFTALAKIESLGYLALISQCAEAIHNQSHEFRPQVWARRVANFVAAYRSPHAAEQFVTEKICAKWGVQAPEEISKTLSCHLGENFVAKLFSGFTAYFPMVAQIIIGDFIPTESLKMIGLSTQSILLEQKTNITNEGINSNELQNRINAIFTDYGIPTNFLNMYITGKSMNYSATRCDIGLGHIRRVLADSEVSRLLEALRSEYKQQRGLLTKKKKLKKSPKSRLSIFSTFEERRTIFRERLLKIKNNLSTDVRSEVSRKNQNLTSWLLRNDSNWLDEILPRFRSKKMHHQPTPVADKK